MALSYFNYSAWAVKFDKIFYSIVAISMLLMGALPAKAHEYWIEPIDYNVAMGAPVEAHLRNGQYFEGTTLSFLPRNFRSFNVSVGDQVMEITGTIGDRPAARFIPESEGLHIISQETTESDLTYQKWDKFVAFVEREGLIGTLEAHIAKGWPQEKFKEAYTRYAKSLIVVGRSNDMKDRVLGQRLEIVVEGEPWNASQQRVNVQVLWEGKPFAGRLLSVFRKNGPKGENRDILTLDDDGRATIERNDGGQILVGAVQMIEASEAVRASKTDALWHSLWASTTFEWSE